VAEGIPIHSSKRNAKNLVFPVLITMGLISHYAAGTTIKKEIKIRLILI